MTSCIDKIIDINDTPIYNLDEDSPSSSFLLDPEMTIQETAPATMEDNFDVLLSQQRDIYDSIMRSYEGLL